MRIGKLSSVALLITSIVSSSVFGQIQPIDPEKAKKKKELDERIVEMIDQSIADAAALRLAQNRAVVMTLAGDLYWKFDQKRARELFRGAGSEIANHNLEIERERRENLETSPMMELPDMGDIRQEIIPIIAARDGELAMEMLVQTRPASIADAMARYSARPAPAPGDPVVYDPLSMRATQEIGLEQRIAFQAADQNPDAAIKLIKDTMAKGVSYNVLPLLQKLNRTDEKKAAELGTDVLRRLADANLATSADQFRAALSFLQYASRPAPATPPANPKDKPFVLPEAGVREVANRMATVLLQPAKSMAAGQNLTSAMPVLEKIVPDKVQLLKLRAAENAKTLPAEFKAQQQRQAMFNSNSTPEEILASIGKTQNENEKRSGYQLLSQKIGQIADEARAKRLIDQIQDEQYRTIAAEQFDSQRAMRAAAAGKTDEAKKMIAAITNKRTQLQRLVQLAQQVYRKNTPDDKQIASELMAEAKAMTSEYPQDEDEIANLMTVVGGFAAIEPEAAFRLFEVVIEPFNEFVQASATLSKFNKRDRSFKKGEMLMRASSNQGPLLPFRYVPQMQSLGRVDLERMSGLIDRLGRSDSRTIIRLLVLQSVAR